MKMAVVNANRFIGLLVLAIVNGTDVFGADTIEQARREIDGGRFETAIRILDERLENRPEDAAALKVRALAACGLGRYDAAVRDYEAALNKNPDDAEAHRDLGMLLVFKVKDARHATEHLENYLVLTHEADIPMEVIRILKSLDRGCSKREHQIVEELVRMAQAFEAAGKPKIAIRAYERALRIRPTCSSCNESLGRLLKDERYLAKARLFRSGG
ncbi:MAG TPA: tetratricopeptide repeat protein [bacterium]|nr:tetratricopeptide repeat protein [bacterium]